MQPKPRCERVATEVQHFVSDVFRLASIFYDFAPSRIILSALLHLIEKHCEGNSQTQHLTCFFVFQSNLEIPLMKKQKRCRRRHAEIIRKLIAHASLSGPG